MRAIERLIRRPPVLRGQVVKPDQVKQNLHPSFWETNSFPFLSSNITSNRELIENDFEDYVQGLVKSNGVVFACATTRMLVYSEARFQFQRMEQGRPGELFGTPALSLLEAPWPGATTGELLARMDYDITSAGNAYVTIVDDENRTGPDVNPATARLARLRPDWVEIIIDSPTGNPWGADARVVGYMYTPRETQAAFGTSGSMLLPASHVAHHAPLPDPISRFRGMSWLTPVLREARADTEATEHKKRFFENGTTLGHVVKFSDQVSQDDFDEFVAKFKSSHSGWKNAYNTLFLGGGADVSTISSTLEQVQFAQTQGAGETRIAAASGVPPVIVGLSEGLQAATYSNYSQARRRFADGLLRPLWRMTAGAMSQLVEVPSGSRLWYDDRDIAFLREDRKDVAEIQLLQAQTIRHYTEAGYVPETVIGATTNENLTLLEHSGVFSVQLQEPGSDDDTSRAEVELTETQVANLSALVATNKFTIESIVAAVQNNDLTQLVEDTSEPEPSPLEGEQEPPGLEPGGEGGPAGESEGGSESEEEQDGN